jgi:RNA polymerase sigma-54 factor
MGLDLRLDFKMSQTVVMTPRLQQAIKLLQYSHLEMIDHVQEAILENPTLEVVPDTDDGGTADLEALRKDEGTKERNEVSDQTNGADGDIDWDKFLGYLKDGSSGQGLGGTMHDELPPIETNLTYGQSLADHLLWQLQMVRCLDEERRVARIVIQDLDPRGYCTQTREELAEAAQCSVEIVEDALAVVQALDPIGCGAADLLECLLIQAKGRFPHDSNFPRILRDHMHNLEKRNYAAIAKDLEIDVEDVIEYHRMIKDDLEPAPGRAFTVDEPRYITPDLYVENHEGEWVVVINEEGMPDLRVSRYYQKILREASKKDREYLIDKLKGAEFLIKSINKRRRTIRRVMESILKFQGEFFEHGASRLRPMVLQDVADDIGVHMSTVSRVTTNKYVHTTHGIFELKYFFSAGLNCATGGDLASEAIKMKIKSLVAAENGKRPLSDQAIADLLNRDGVNIARRTVAKYREAMGVLPSSQRKRMF